MKSILLLAVILLSLLAPAFVTGARIDSLGNDPHHLFGSD
jgi:hypothetical protein